MTVRLSVTNLRDVITGRRYGFVQLNGNLTRLVAIPEWIDIPTWTVNQDWTARDGRYGSASRSEQEYQEGDRPPWMGSIRSTVRLDAPFPSAFHLRTGYAADESGQYIAMDAFSAQHAPFGERGVEVCNDGRIRLDSERSDCRCRRITFNAMRH